MVNLLQLLSSKSYQSTHIARDVVEFNFNISSGRTYNRSSSRKQLHGSGVPGTVVQPLIKRDRMIGFLGCLGLAST